MTHQPKTKKSFKRQDVDFLNMHQIGTGDLAINEWKEQGVTPPKPS